MTARGLAWCALALVAACGAESKTPSGPLDRIRLPTGLAVVDGRVIVASSNADLLFDERTGGSVIALDPLSLDTVRIAGAVNVRSFAGELAVARPGSPGPGLPAAQACGTDVDPPPGEPARAALAVFGTRGSNTLNVLSVSPAGALACVRCGISPGPGVGDPLAVEVACGGGRARAFTGYLGSTSGAAMVGELDLVTHALRTFNVGIGSVRGFAYDRERDRLYMVGVATGVPTPLRWVDLGGCTVGLPAGAGGCTVGSATLSTLPRGLELRSLALGNPGAPGTPRRAYATARLYDADAAAVNGFRTTDFGGLLLVLDLVDDAFGGVEPQVVRSFPIGRGAQTVRVLPRHPGWAADRRDVVAALAVDAGVLWIYDDEERTLAAFGKDEATGAPLLGHEPFGLAVDPVAAGTTARLWVGSYRDGFVTPVDVALDAPDRAAYAGGAQRRISGATP